MRLFLVALSLIVAQTSAASYRIQAIQEKGKTRLIGVQDIEQRLPRSPLVRKLPFFLAEGPGTSENLYLEYIQDGLPKDVNLHSFTENLVPIENAEVKELVIQGPKENRINLTYVGDGYTLAEKEKFFADVQRLTHDLFSVSTFGSYLPLFNVYAVFVPSKDSGITDLERKDTAFGLYRSPPGSKRGIYPGNTHALERAIALAPSTDYPIVIANDEYYGGLGGRYAITTSSETSGSMVLRHELGHNFGDVGEEYDGGSVYSGANSSSKRNLKWKHWTEGEPEFYQAQLLKASYPWHNLNEGPLSYSMNVAREIFERGLILFDFSTVGWQVPEIVRVQLNGKPLPLRGEYGIDRGFFFSEMLRPTHEGRHELLIEQAQSDGKSVLASIRAYAFPDGYDFTEDKIAAFATYNSWGMMAGYRPTHASCLMRDMQVTKFCAVDQENMWLRFLNRVRLIDEVEKIDLGDDWLLKVKTPQLPDLNFKWRLADTSRKVLGEGDEIRLPKAHGFKAIRVEAFLESEEIGVTTPLTSDVKVIEL